VTFNNFNSTLILKHEFQHPAIILLTCSSTINPLNYFRRKFFLLTSPWLDLARILHHVYSVSCGGVRAVLLTQ